MLGKITYIADDCAHVKILENSSVSINLMNLHVVFEDSRSKILGEVVNIDDDVIIARFLGEFKDGTFYSGIINKPELTANVRIINEQELAIIIGTKTNDSFLLGRSPLYNNFPITTNVNELFGHHMAIFGSSGSGKSCGFASIIQHVFSEPTIRPVKSNIIIFDTYGEYETAFKDINQIDPNFNFKLYSASDTEGTQSLKIPLWFLKVEDFALLLGATKHIQLNVIEQSLKLAKIFAMQTDESEAYKNHIIAKAILSVFYSNLMPAAKKNDIFKIFASCETVEFNLDAEVAGIGYVRKFRDCFNITTTGDFSERVLITEYINSHINDELERIETTNNVFFTLEDFERAMNFCLISEGYLYNEKAYNDAVGLKTRLKTILESNYAKFFKLDQYMNMEQYLNFLLTKNGKRTQIININFEDIDDWFAKALTKIMAKMLFNFCKNLPVRGSFPFHLFLEEAHRYISNDHDTILFGYNIFNRIAKEGRKYGMILSVITQRPVEMNEDVVSQCANFIMFKMTHPRDIEFIREMLPNIAQDIVEKQKSLQPGTCVVFGKAFKIPLIVTMDMPNPEPNSSNVDIVNRWR